MKDIAFIVCGALAREVLALNKKHNWGADVFGLPVLLHNEPDRIPPAVLERIIQEHLIGGKVVEEFLIVRNDLS